MSLYNRQRMEIELEHLDQLDQEVSARVANGEMDGFEARRMGAKLERMRRGCRMKLVNTGQLVGDLRAATAEAATGSDRGRFRENAAWNRIRNASLPDGSSRAPESTPSPLAAVSSREISLDTPQGLAEAKALQIAGWRLVWRPNGRNVAIAYDF